MKKVLLASLMLFSVNALALSADSTWESINASYNTDVKAPQVAFAAGQATTFVSIFDTCVAGDKIETAVPFNVYKQVKSGGRDSGTELVVVGQEILSRAMTYTTTVSAGEHGRERTITVTIPTHNMIDVYSKSMNDRTEGRLLFTKAFDIPACQ